MATSYPRPSPQVTGDKPSIFSSLPWWAWVAGAGVLVVLFLVIRGGSASAQQTTTSGGNTSNDTQSLSDLESSLQQLLAQSGQSSSGLGGGGAGDGLTSTSVSPPANINFLGPPTPAPGDTQSPLPTQPSYFGGGTLRKGSNPQPIASPAPTTIIQKSSTGSTVAVTTTPSGAQTQLANEIGVYQNLTTLNPKQAAALQTDIATYEKQYGALSGGINPVAVTSTIPGQSEVMTSSQLQGTNRPAGQTDLAAQAAKRLGYSVNVPAVQNATPTSTASKTTSTPFIKTVAGGGTASVT